MPKQLETILLAILTELNQGSTPVSRKSLDYPIAEVFPTTIERRRFFSLLVDRSDAALRSSGMTTTGMRETLRVFENEIDAGVPVTSRNLLAALSSLLGVVSHAILRKKSRTISERMVQRTSLSTIKDGVFPKHPSRHAPAKRAPRPAYRIIRALKGTGREASTPKSRHSSVRIFYATDRKQIEVKPVKFSGLRGTDLTYGTCEVSIPKAHKIGTLESPSLFRLELRQASLPRNRQTP